MNFDTLLGIAQSKQYTDDSIAGGGISAGKPCQIKSIEDITGGHKVTFAWYLDNGKEQNGYMNVMDGASGEPGQPGEPGEPGEPGLGIKSVNIRTIDGKDHLIITYDDDTTEDAGIISGGGGGGDASLETDVTSNLTVGAIQNGTKLPKGTTFTEFAQKLLITEIAPEYTLTLTKSGNVAYGDSYTETMTCKFSTLGTSTKLTNIKYYANDTLVYDFPFGGVTPGTWSYTMPTPTTDTTTFKTVVTYIKSDGTTGTLTKTASINFYYNKFHGAVSDVDPDEATVEALTKVLATGKGGTYSFTVTAGRICYAYPKSLGALSSIKDGNGFSLFDSFTRTEQNYTQNGTTVPYYRYVLTDATTVSGYSIVFA